jgi:hypothetical protein
MNTVPRLLAIAALALCITACSTTKKSDCCGSGKCAVDTEHMHPAKKKAN